MTPPRIGWRFFPILAALWLFLEGWNNKSILLFVDAFLVLPSVTSTADNGGAISMNAAGRNHKGEDADATADADDVYYRYFCYGSNVLPSTMENLRGIQPLDATAAVLPGYRLRFLGSDGPFEPSAAFVVPSESAADDDDHNHDGDDESSNNSVHGVMYTLTAKDFARVGTTEGVPFGYRWKRCQVYPYVGKEGEDISITALLETSSKGQDAVTLVPPDLSNISPTDVPPSSSYLDIIKEGARYWKLDASYRAKLERIPTAKNLVVPGGLSGPLLRLAELSAKFRRKS